MLDPAVVITTSALMSLVLLVLLGSLLRSGKQGVQEWFAANLCVVVALPMILLRGHISDVFSIVVANVLLALGAAAYYAGCARFLERNPHWPRMLTGVAAVGAAVVYWRYGVDSIPLRVFFTTLFSAVICLAVVLVLRQRPAGRSAYPYRATTLMAVIFGVCQLLRGLYFVTLDATPGMSMFTATGNVVLLIATGLMPVLSMCAMMMVHDALLADARDAANRDFLTGALSRKGFETLARAQISRASLLDQPLSLLIIDLDHFKRINDTLGHAAGDGVLRAFVGMAHAQLRQADALGRLGGEEFALLLPDTDVERAVSLAERLRGTAAAQAVMVGSAPCQYTLSGGLASWQSGETFDRLCARADKALYEAKRAGRNRICVDPAGEARQPGAGGGREALPAMAD
jgi:diguanylate cyclase (GGDEF)-like protein